LPAIFFALGAVFLVLAILMLVAIAAVVRAREKPGQPGASPAVAIVGLSVGAALLGLLAFIMFMTANSDSFGR